MTVNIFVSEPQIQFQSGVVSVNETQEYAEATIVRTGTVLYKMFIQEEGNEKVWFLLPIS